MKIPKNILTLALKSEEKIVNDIDNEIIDDSALVECMNQLNLLREDKSIVIPISEKDILTKINQVNAEMSWFSQWLSVKSNSAA